MTPAVIDALCRLNSHARAYGCGKRAIYSYKTLIAAMLGGQGDVATRLLRWTGRCGRCAGTGIWEDWCDGYKAPCRHCNHGIVTLKFVETTLPDGRIWHHPYEHNSGVLVAQAAGACLWQYNRQRYENAAGDEAEWRPVTSEWAPQKPGERLSADDAAMALNTVETWLLLAPIPRWTAAGIGNTLHWPAECAKREMRRYHIDLGRVGVKCWYCGHPQVVMGHGRCGPPFDWSVPTCAEHSKIEIERWPQSSDLPASAVTPPLFEWRERHERLGFDRERDW